MLGRVRASVVGREDRADILSTVTPRHERCGPLTSGERLRRCQTLVSTAQQPQPFGAWLNG